MNTIIRIIIVAIAILQYSISDCQAASFSIPIFLEAYRNEQSFLRDTYSKIAFSYKHPSGKSAVTYHGITDFDNHLIKAEGPETVNCRNRKYTFSIQKNTSSMLYRIGSCDFNNRDNPATSLSFIHAPWCDLELQIPLYDVFTNDRYYISDIDSDSLWFGQPCYKITIKSVASTSQPDNSPGKIQFYLDHTYHYVCIGQKLTLDDGFLYTRCTYDIAANGLLKKYEVGRINASGVATPRFNVELFDVKQINTNIDYDQFRLSFYGLPEPEGVVWEKTIPSYVWYLSIAGGALVLFFIAGWLLKRRAKARAAAVPATSPLPPPRVE